MNTLIDQIFGEWADADKDRPFMVIKNGPAISRHDFQQLINQLGNALIELGVKPDDRVAVQVEKSPQAFALYFAVVKIGAIFLPLNTSYTINELNYFIEDAAPRVVVASSSVCETLQDKFDAVCIDLDEHGVGQLMERAHRQSKMLAVVPRSADDLAAILYTSGTTGRSKGAMLSHNNLLSNAEMLRECWQFSDKDVLLHALPIYHTHGLFVAGNVMTLVGGTMIYLPKFDRDDIIHYLPQATTMMGVPTFYTRLLQDDRFSKDLTQHMRLFISGSAPLLAETHIAFEDRTGHKILERYGMTETNMNTSNPYHGERRAGTVGFPLPGVELRVVDAEQFTQVPDGTIGILEVKGPNVTSGYWQNTEKTEESFRSDGYFITGDMGVIDADGYVTIVGRDKDLIISGGLNIYPKEIEDMINSISGVNESAVIGISHPDFGEAVVAVIVREDSGVGQRLSEKHIMDELAENMAKFKQPKTIIFMDALPRNTMGKVQKAEMRKTYADLFQ